MLTFHPNSFVTNSFPEYLNNKFEILNNYEFVTHHEKQVLQMLL